MNIFVTRLNYDTTENDLQVAFERFGAVASARIIMDRDTGRSRGFGFVEMENEEDGNEAIAQLNDTELDGRTIVVKQAEDKRGGGGGRPSGGGGGRGGFDRRGGGGGYGSRDRNY